MDLEHGYHRIFRDDCRSLGIDVQFGVVPFRVYDGATFSVGEKLLLIFQTEGDMNLFKLSSKYAYLIGDEIEVEVEQPELEDLLCQVLKKQ